MNLTFRNHIFCCISFIKAYCEDNLENNRFPDFELTNEMVCYMKSFDSSIVAPLRIELRSKV